jgi:large subunit ribosomal protein L28
MSRICDSSGKKGRSGGFSYVRSGVPKKQGGIGLNIRGKTLRWYRPNLQKVRVLLPNGTVRRMTLAVSVIKKGEINVKIGGKMRTIPLVKATRGRQALWLKQREAEAGEE